MTPATIANAIERARKADRSGFYGNTVPDLIAATEWLLRENARLVAKEKAGG